MDQGWKSINPLQKNLGSTLQDMAVGITILELLPKSGVVKFRISKRNYIKLSFCSAKEMISRVKKQLIEEKNFTHYTTARDIQRSSGTQQQRNKTTLWKTGKKKWAGIFQKSKFKWLVDTWKKKCSGSVELREMQIKSTMRFQQTPHSM